MSGSPWNCVFQVVNEIITDSLLIPKIWPAPPVITADVLTAEVYAINNARITTPVPHGIVVGQTIVVRGITPIVFNGQFVVQTANATQLTYAVVSSNVVVPTPVTGTVTTVNLPESLADFPALTTDAERTHDGLWVKADGGLVST